MSKIESHEQEVRFALVLYGGVSLAIYINGVMQEMLQLVRSTSGAQLSPEDGSANVYRKLGAMLSPERKIELPADDAPIKTKFKVDVISGTSAGGINGIFLAKALANGAKNLDQIQELWFSEGAIESLLNDSASYADMPLNQPKKTASLLNSRRMYLKLLNAFDGMDEPNTQRDTLPLADEIDLFATTTDIEGVPVPIQLLDNVVYERRYRNAFHFRFMMGERNDFEQDNNPFLAFAARCTSSFPFAFEPMQLCNIDEILQSSTKYAKKKYCLSESPRWQKFYTNYLKGIIDTAKPFPQRPFGDGGYLNNKPFSYAVDALLNRQSVVPVDRKLFYVEPSPLHPEEEKSPKDPPNAIQNSMDALIVIPGYQTIRNDLMQVLDRNRQATKINKTLSEVELEIQPGDDKCDPPATGLEEIWFQGDDCYRAYYRMRAAEVTDEITTMIARIYSIEENSAYFYALRSVVRVWREAMYDVASAHAANDWMTQWRERAVALSSSEATREGSSKGFLKYFDLPYRLRRLRFLLRKLDGLYNLKLRPSHPSYADALKILNFGRKGEPLTTAPEKLGELRATVYEQYRELSGLLQTLLEPPLPKDDQSPDLPPEKDEIKAVREALFGSESEKGTEKEKEQKRKSERKSVLGLLSKILDQQDLNTNDAVTQSKWMTTRPIARKIDEPADLEKLCDLRALKLVQKDATLQLRLGTAGVKLKELLYAKLIVVQEELNKSFDACGDAGTIAKRFYHCFDLYDAVQYPMAFNTDIGETDVVQIVRVAPEDATALGPDDVVERRAKLKGLVAAHFGAFLDLDWRVNDLLWGRLDAAERIITALLPWDDDHVKTVRDQLINEAQYQILQNFKAPQRLLEMAIRQAVHNGPQARVSDTSLEGIIGVAAPLVGPNRVASSNFMRVWNDTVPTDPNPTLMARTLARATQITGHILETISDGKALKKQAAWLTNAGRTLWGLVEISVPRSLWELLGKYWQSLLLLVAIILLAAGLISGQKGVAGVGWSLVGLTVALFTIRSFLRSKMGGGRNIWGFIRGVLILAALILLVLGGHTAYKLSICDLPQWLIKHGCNIIAPQCEAATIIVKPEQN